MIWNNLVTTPQRWMAYYLRRKGWVCFYLEDYARSCPAMTQGTHASPHDCWLALYQESERQGKRAAGA